MDQPIQDTKEEATLVRKARWGSQKAFECLYERHARAVYALAYRLTDDAQSAEDITQDVFMRMLQFLGGFREGLPLRPWLKRVTANLAIDLLRKRREHFIETWDDPRMPVVTTEDHETELAALLRRLPPLARTLVWLHQVEGWSHQELGERFGNSPSWSKSIVSRALARLRLELDPHEHTVS